MAPTRVILMSCGSYNPPTNMHLRMFEIARDHLHRMGTHVVVGAVISPTHDDYAKKELASSEHRCAMLKLATQNSDWIRVSTWETRQNGWTKTRLCLQYHQNLLNSILLNANDTNCRVELQDADWVPENVRNSGDRTPIQIKLLCGADLLESFGTPGLWADEDIDAIVGQHGLVVITREGSNPNKFIYDSDILSKYMHNIYIVTEWIPNEVSSTKIRRALKRGESVRYLVQDSVIDYVYKHGIYDAKTVSTIKLELSTTNANNYLCIQPKYENAFLTPSPSDVTMTTPSPVEIISIDINETILKRNYQNSSSNGRENFSRDDNEDLREKFNAVTSDNGNKSVAQNKVAYPGLAKQIIANESGESKIFCEVGLSCISENYKVEMEIDGKTGHYEDSSTKDIEGSLEITEIDDDGIDNYGQSENTPTPDDSEGKISVILSIDVIDSSNIDFTRRSSKQDIASVILEPIENKQDTLENEESAESKEEESPIKADESIKANYIDADSTIDEDKSKTGSKEAKIPINIESIDESHDSRIEDQCIDISTDKIVDETKIEDHRSSDVDQDSISEELIDKRDGAIEIDGKYIMSVVNSRKSPKKLKNEENEGVETRNIEISRIDRIESTDKSNENELVESSIGATPFSRTESIRKSIKTSGRRRGVVFQGSLDSINVNEDKSTIVTSDKKISKKSKSYEFIKPTCNQPTTIYKIPLNDADFSKDENSTIKLEVKGQEAEVNEVTDDFCSVCCYQNEPSINENLCDARLTGSSPIEEPVCEICSKSDLQEETLKNAFEPIAFKSGEPVCELCEICGDAAMDEDVVASSRPEKDEFVDRRILGSRPLPLSLPKRKKVRLNARSLENVDSDDYEDEDDVDHFEIDDNGASRRIIDTRDKLKYLGEKKSIEERTSDDTNSNEDEFEIENCGLDVADGAKNLASRYKNAIDDKLRNIVPENEIVNEKITRTSSLVNRETNDSGRFKRRYSSVDNLPNTRTIVKSSGAEKPNSLKSRAIKGLVSSADNIRPVRNSRSRTLRKSADDVTRGYQSSLDDTRELPLYENIGRKKMTSKDEPQHKPRDSGTIKMILTKHGIKIISDKETAL